MAETGEMKELERTLAAELEPFFGGHVLLALSGGADSTALAAAFSRLRSAKIWGGNISVCHVNHGQRDEAAEDEDFCRRLCTELNLPLAVINLASRADFRRGAGEEELRLLRYRALGQAATDCGAAYIATAHNLDDQAETLLFRLFRGSSPRGLTAMKESRRLDFLPEVQGEGLNEITLIRPLLSLSRSQILAYLESLSLSFREDASNQDRRFKRNFIRHEILPRVLESFPEALANIENLRHTLKAEDSFLGRLAQDCLDQARVSGEQALDAVYLSSLDAALLARVAVLFMEERGVEPSFSRVGAFVHTLAGGRLSLGDGMELLVQDGLVRLTLERGDDSLEQQTEALRSWMTPLEVRLPEPEGRSRLTIIPWLNRALRVECENVSSTELDLGFPAKDAPEILVDLASVRDLAQGQDGLKFRLRREGDFIVPFGMQEVVRLKQYLRVNHKQAGRSLWRGTPLADLSAEALRRLTPVLAAGAEVLWVPGWGLSEKLRARSSGLARFTFVELST